MSIHNDNQPEKSTENILEDNIIQSPTINYPTILPLTMNKEKLHYGKVPFVLRSHTPNKHKYLRGMPVIYCFGFIHFMVKQSSYLNITEYIQQSFLQDWNPPTILSQLRISLSLLFILSGSTLYLLLTFALVRYCL